MRYSDDYYDEKQEPNMTLIYMALIMSFTILVIVGFVFWQNAPKRSAAAAAKQKETAVIEDEKAAAAASLDGLISGSTLTSDQLDIWSIPENTNGGEEKNNTSTSGNAGTVVNQTTGETLITGKTGTDSKNTASELMEGKTAVYDMTQKESVKGEEEETLNDGQHTKITYADGTEEWVQLDPELPLNIYEKSRLVYQKPIMKYYVDGKQASCFGVDISMEQGVVDFNKLKKAGCNFVMIKAGSRGYSSGQLVLDEYFKDYIKGATNAGLAVGVYFFSQAVTKEEAVEEAQVLLSEIDGCQIKYPVVFDMETIDGDAARIDALDNAARTTIAQAFLECVKEAGYLPMIYGNKEWLMTKINLQDLQDYDIWLAQEADIPDYPYQFHMWQYTKKGSISGISGEVNMNISFIDYTAK